MCSECSLFIVNAALSTECDAVELILELVVGCLVVGCVVRKNS